MKNTNVTIRLDDELKAQAEELFDDLGMSLSTAVNVFLRQCVRDQGIPFAVTRNGAHAPKMGPVEAQESAEEDEMFSPMAMPEENYYGQFGNFSSFMNAINEMDFKEE